jgi:ATP-binding cassette subfamily F protein 3
MTAAQTKLEALEQQLGDTELYNAENKTQLKQVLTEQANHKSTLEEAEMYWLDAQEELEIKQKEFELESVS